MEVVYVFNGLGNQMSQYAIYLRKKEMGHSVKCYFRNTGHNGIELEKLFGIKTPFSILSPIYNLINLIYIYTKHKKLMSVVKKVLSYLGIHSIIEKADYSYNSEILNEHDGITFIIGGWHHYKYLCGFEKLIKSQYVFPDFRDERNIRIKEAGTDGRNVAIHIRRGDYVTSDLFGPVCNEQYYMKSILYFESIIEKPVFYVFSNDIEWSKRLLKNKKAVFVDWNIKENSWADMALMSSFRNLIIANSTFSWWAAWLGMAEKVVCPPYLINGDENSDIFKPEWTRIDNSINSHEVFI